MTSGCAGEGDGCRAFSQEDRRSESRHPCRLSVRFRRLATPGLWAADDPVFSTASATNISPSGIGLETDFRMEPGQQVELEVNDPYGPGQFAGTVKVVHISRVTGEGIVFGFQVGLRGGADGLWGLWERTRRLSAGGPPGPSASGQKA